MAYFQKYNNEDQNQNQNQAQNSGGNIYSTSQSEVSSVSDSGASGNSRSTNTESNKSGNWVNLNQYLDANQGKVGGYVDKLVDPYTSKQSDYEANVGNSYKNYSDSITSDDAYRTDSNTSKNISNNFLRNNSTENVSDDQLSQWYNTYSKGYQGAGRLEDTGDDFGYNANRKQADEFNTVGTNLNNENYLQSLMGNNVSSGFKNLNSFLIGGTQSGRDSVKKYQDTFSDLVALLDNSVSDAGSLYDNVTETAANNQEAAKQNYNDNLQTLYQEIITQQNAAKDRANDQKAKVESDNARHQTHIGLPTKTNSEVVGTMIDTSPYTFTPNTNADALYEAELRELEQRARALQAGQRGTQSGIDNYSYGQAGVDWTGFNARVDQTNNALQQAYADQIKKLEDKGYDNASWVRSQINQAINNDSIVREFIQGLINGTETDFGGLSGAINAAISRQTGGKGYTTDDPWENLQAGLSELSEGDILSGLGRLGQSAWDGLNPLSWF